MRSRTQALIYTLCTIGGILLCSAFATLRVQAQSSTPAPADSVTTPTLHYPVAKTSPTSYEEYRKEQPIDLATPENISTQFEYDIATGYYIMRTKVGEMEVSTPFMLNAKEYNQYSLEESRKAYYRQKNAEAFAKGEEEFNFMDMQFDIGALDKVFGPGGVQIKTQGSAELSFGVKTNVTDNPTLSTYARKKTFFDFDEKIQANVTASVGEKMSFTMNYNTDATFEFDSKQLKLQYEGDEDEIIKNIEAGNVSLTTGSSLIRGGVALFGIKTTMQFGKLKATALISQQESESKTINTEGGAQMSKFEIRADQYDENRHFFLSHYFRNNYDRFMAKLPYISSGITINRIEVWVTNKQGNYTQARNIVGFMDMGEGDPLYCGAPDGTWGFNASSPYPSNGANTLYNELTALPDARNITLVTEQLGSRFPQLNGGVDYAKIESARLLNSSEYTLNSSLGYISLKTTLHADEVLAVAFEYTCNGQVYQVGEFSSNVESSTSCLFLKMLKGTTISTAQPIWDLMMKNIYSLNAYQVQKEKFRLNVQYHSDTTGVKMNYLSVGNINKELLIKVMNLDRLDSNEENNPDGFFDYVENYTINPTNGRIIFPVVEPFGEHLRRKIGDTPDADRYVYQELYDSTLVVAKQFSEKNKFYLAGEYKSSAGAEIRLNAMNVPRGSVVVTAGGQTLTENVDYSVDYNMGIVRIENESYIESGAPISVTLENQSLFSMQRKTMLGLDLNYAFNKDFSVGATIMHLSEKPLTEKLNVGDEVLNNTLWGTNVAYNTQFQWLTKWVDYLPFVTATQPSSLSVKGEFAQLIAGSSRSSEKGISYIDDFETSQTAIDVRTPYSWFLSSIPYDSNNPLFPEAADATTTRSGENRALLAWYYIDPLFTQRNSSSIPNHLKNDLDQLSNHYVREVNSREVYPNKELAYGQSSTLQVLNLSFYPEERGPYNLDAEGIDPTTGALTNPEERWGGIMRKMDNSDFESSNVEYIQFWMLDPFLYNEKGENRGGDLYFNLGEVSEDILKDGVKSFENGLPADGDPSQLSTTAWGRVSRNQPLSEGFDQSNREAQDVGLDGLSTDDEQNFAAYKNYKETLQGRLSSPLLEKMAQDPFSPLNDPAGDDYSYYRSTHYDNFAKGVLERYKRYNGVEGNSLSADLVGDNLYMASRSVPDMEDINQDNTLNEYERYYQYRISVRPEDLTVGSNHITDKRTTTVTLRNGATEEVSWYQFKIPVDSYEKRVGAIQDFKTIRFMRMFMTAFNRETHLRFASLELVRGEWRTYTKSLNPANPSLNGSLETSVVNIEENAGQEPVNYVLPPGVSRVVDPSQSQITQLNEQAISLKVNDLSPDDALAIYKNTNLDMRLYKRLQMFVHAERFIDDVSGLQNGEVSLFIRLGSDNTTNYYEYEVPLNLTEAGDYDNNNSQDQAAVWPSENMLNFPLELLTELKLKRNAAKRAGVSAASFTERYSIYDPEKPKNRVSIIGNPSLATVSTILIGVRNNARTTKDATVWVNELRMTEFDQSGGWAAKGNMNLGISDLATVNVGGYVETQGFGGIDQSLLERRMDDYYQYDVATTVELGRFLPEKAQVSAPLFYSVSQQKTSPKYNPLDQDILLRDALDASETQSERDSIQGISVSSSTIESFSLAGVRSNVRSKTPMPYDPANFTASYSFNRQSQKDPTALYENTIDHRGSLNYVYAPSVKPLTPFSFIKSNSANLKFFKTWSINYLPNNISFSTNLSRYYYEQQLRDLDLSTGASTALPLVTSKNFLWDRQFAIQWNLFKSLQLSLNTSTGARIDETAGVVNRELYPDQYEAWRDTVRNSLLSMGTPWSYTQTFSGSYTVPFNAIPALNWVTGQVKYNATYYWDKGAQIDENTTLGNTISNQGQWSFEGRMNLESLYNKSPFLKKTNTKFNTTSRPGVSTRKPALRNYKRDVKLLPDTLTLIKHNLDNKRLIVLAEDREGNPLPINYKAVDRDNIEIKPLEGDSLGQMITLTITQKPSLEGETWYKVAQYGARAAMSVRNIAVRYQRANTLNLPSFLPSIGDFMGQRDMNGFMSPGLAFAFGMADENYVQEAIERNWLLMSDSIVTPASITRSEDLQMDATLEPLRGLKITLTAKRSNSNNSQVQFMFEGMPTVQGGNFTMTHISLASAFESSKAENGYASPSFDRFQEYRQVMTQRLERAYQRLSYPTSGFLQSSEYAGAPYNATNGAVSSSSSDVLIPAFLAAYTGKDATKSTTSPFPEIRELLPNWRLTYNGLSQLPLVKKYFRTVNLNHAYSCVYTVGAYSSFLNWVAADKENNLGFVRNEQSGMPIPSSPFDISSVTITESFAPLAGVDVTLKNNITGRFEYKNSRTLSLNSSSGQLVEATTRDITIGSGYKIANLRAFFKLKNKQGAFNNDLNLRADLSFRRAQALIRRIDEDFTQATSGTETLSLKISADYTLSKAITLRGFFDRQVNNPLVSSTSYPTSNTNFGLALRLSLMR